LILNSAPIPERPLATTGPSPTAEEGGGKKDIRREKQEGREIRIADDEI
jgi:hypothetical protein